MLKLNGQSILLGGFHDHWSRAGGKNSALLLAALDYYHYDFMTLMDGDDEVHQKLARQLSQRIRIYPGREEFFGWGHVVTVNPRAPRCGADDGNYEATLRRLQESCDLVILAHPEYPTTWELITLSGEIDRLMDSGAIHGVNLINTAGFEDPKLRWLIDWFKKRDGQGLHTPIVNGWDAHMLLAQRDLPKVLYSGARSPKGHIDTAGASRTILFCVENSLPAIIDAVKKGDTVIEDLKTGELVGPQKLVAFLRDNGYAQEMSRLDKIRDGYRLSVPGTWMPNETCHFELPHEGELQVTVPTPDGLQEAKFKPVKKSESLSSYAVDWSLPPDVVNQDYAAIALQTPDGHERIWAVETRHPVQLDLLPLYRDGEPGVELRALRPFAGLVSVRIPGLLEWTGKFDQPSMWLPLPGELEKNYIQSAQWTAQLPNGLRREEQKTLTFITAPKFGGDWNKVPVYPVDDLRFTPVFSYGISRPYPGADVYALYLQFAWDDDAMYMRARVKDAVHFQPKTGRFVYEADCLQLSFDSLLRRDPTIGRFYSFNMALTPQGPELFRWLGPFDESTEGFIAPGNDQSLGSKYIQIDPCAGGLIYNLRLPWSELAPAKGARGHRMGVYVIGMNNNGEGLLDSVHWPLHFPGMWVIPNRWGVINLI